MVALQPKLPQITLLTDLGLVGADAWGLAIKGSERAPAATFIIDREGVVRYRKLGDARGDWPPYAELASVLH